MKLIQDLYSLASNKLGELASPIIKGFKMKDYVNMVPKALQQRGESWLETIAAGVAAVLSVVVFCLIVLMLGV